ncbi:MAG: type VII toxin-antitoxin system MntA family adenylyltransferase antitoxin [Candidatus Hodarchaeales archaeon]
MMDHKTEIEGEILGLEALFSEMELSLFLEENSIQLVYLYGSAARKELSPISDIDIAIFFCSTFTDQLGKELILGELEERLSQKVSLPLQIVELNPELILFAFQIIYNGKVLYSSSETIRTVLESRVILNYCDFRPFIDVQNHYELNIREVG